MIAWLRRWLAPPLYQDEEENRVARLAHSIAISMLVVAPLTGVVLSAVTPNRVLLFSVVGALIVAAVAALELVRRGRIGVAGWLMLLVLYAIVTQALVRELGVRNPMITGYLVVVILASLLLGGRGAAIAAGVSGLTVAAIYLAEINGVLVVNIEPGPPSLAQMISPFVMFLFALLLMRFSLETNAGAFRQLRQAASALRQANEEMEGSRDALAERAATLERRTGYLQASADVSRAVVSILDQEQLVARVVELIRDRFGLYYVGLFLVDDQWEWLNLRAGTGAAGQAMLARGHRLRMGQGMIGWSALQGQSRVAQEAGADEVRVSQAELPETRAEAALPLKSRGKVMGAITVQDSRAGTFDQETVGVLQVLADQVAVALDNARLLRESQLALEAERRAYGEISTRGWAEMVRRGQGVGYVYRPGGDMAPAQGPWSDEMMRATRQGEVVVGDEQPVSADDGDGAGATVVVPIKIRDRVMGVVRLQKMKEGRAWTEEELALMQTLTSQLEVALESARLHQDTQRRAAQERLVGEVTARMRETLDMDAVVKTATQQMRQALGLHDVTIRLEGVDSFAPEGTRVTPEGTRVTPEGTRVARPQFDQDSSISEGGTNVGL